MERRARPRGHSGFFCFEKMHPWVSPRFVFYMKPQRRSLCAGFQVSQRRHRSRLSACCRIFLYIPTKRLLWCSPVWSLTNKICRTFFPCPVRPAAGCGGATQSPRLGTGWARRGSVSPRLTPSPSDKAGREEKVPRLEVAFTVRLTSAHVIIP